MAGFEFEVPSPVGDHSDLFAMEFSAGSLLIGASELSKETTLGDLANALLRSVVLTVSAGKPPDRLLVADVASVRPTTPPGATDTDKSAFVIDFGRLRTMSSIYCGGTVKIYRIYPWSGTRFVTTGTEVIFTDNAGNVDDGFVIPVEFAERQTERVLVVTDPTTLDTFRAHAVMDLPTPPTDLELLINGKRVWFRPGVAVPAPGDDNFTTTVNVTGEVQALVDAGASSVVATLKAATPGLLGLEERLPRDMLRQHRVVFPEGDVRTVVAPEEGIAALPLPVPAGASSWTIHQISFIASGEMPATRVQPSSGPPAALDLLLTLDAEHAAIVRLPSSQLDPFATLHGVRILVGTGPEGAEIAGVLRADLDNEPGELIDAPSLGPVSLDAIDPAAPTFVTLALPRPRKLTRLTPQWIAIQVSRGTVFWPVTVPEAADQLINPIRRGLPAGPFHPLPTLSVAPHGLGAVIRVIGEPAPDVPIQALEGWLPGSNRKAFSPSPEGRPVSLPAEPLISGSGAGVISSGQLQLQLRANTPGTFSFRDVRIVRG